MSSSNETNTATPPASPSNGARSGLAPIDGSVIPVTKVEAILKRVWNHTITVAGANDYLIYECDEIICLEPEKTKPNKAVSQSGRK